MAQNYEECIYFRKRRVADNIRMLGICTHPLSGIEVTENITTSLCFICHLFRGRKK